MKIHPGGATIKIVKIIVYVVTFAVVIAIAVAIAALSLSVAPAAAKSTLLGKIAIILGGFAVTGGVIYLAEKLINVIKEVGNLVTEIIVEKYKKTQLEAGIKIGIEQGIEQGVEIGREQGVEIGREQGVEIGREQGVEIGREQGVEIGREQGVEIGREQERQAWQGWYQRQETAHREGRPFNEPPPGYSPDANANGPDRP